MEMTTGYLGVARILRERALGEYGFDRPEPSALAAFIAERAGIGIGLAESLVWAEVASPSAEDLASIARAFTLDQDLLSILLVPSSPDIIEHVMRNVVLGALNSEGCDVCYELEAAILGGGELADLSETELALEALSHLVPVDAGEDETEEDPDAQELETLLATVVGLDRAARQRVLAFALGEATKIDSDEDARRVRAFASLRQEIFGHLLNAAFDQIAVSRDGEIDEQELAHRLNLSDPGTVRRLPAMVEEALDKLHDRGALAEAPLRVDGPVLSLADDARGAWLALLEAEHSPLLISRPAA